MGWQEPLSPGDVPVAAEQLPREGARWGGQAGSPLLLLQRGARSGSGTAQSPPEHVKGSPGWVLCLLHPSVFSHLRAGWGDAGIVAGKAGRCQHPRGCSEPLKSPWPFPDSGPHLQTPAAVWMRNTLMFCCAKPCCWCLAFPPSSPPLAGRQRSPPRCAERAGWQGAA